MSGNANTKESHFDKLHGLPLELVYTYMLKCNKNSQGTCKGIHEVAQQITNKTDQKFKNLVNILTANINDFLNVYAAKINQVIVDNVNELPFIAYIANAQNVCKMVPLFLKDYTTIFQEFFNENPLEGVTINEGVTIKIVTMSDGNIIDDTYLVIHAKDAVPKQLPSNIKLNDCFISFSRQVSQFHMKLNVHAELDNSNPKLVKLSWNKDEDQIQNLFTFLKIVYGFGVFQQRNGGADKKQNDKVHVLGRWRTVQKVGRKKMIKYKGELIPLSEAKRMK